MDYSPNFVNEEVENPANIQCANDCTNPGEQGVPIDGYDVNRLGTKNTSGGCPWNLGTSQCDSGGQQLDPMYGGYQNYKVAEGNWTAPLCSWFIPKSGEPSSTLVKPGQSNAGLDWSQWRSENIKHGRPTSDSLNKWLEVATRCDQPNAYECYKFAPLEGEPWMNTWLSDDLIATGVDPTKGISAPRQGSKWACSNDDSPVEMVAHPQGLDIFYKEDGTPTDPESGLTPVVINKPGAMITDRATDAMCSNLSPSEAGSNHSLCDWYPLYNEYIDDPMPIRCNSESEDQWNKRTMSSNTNFKGIAPGNFLTGTNWFKDSDFYNRPGGGIGGKGVLLQDEKGPDNNLAFWSGQVGGGDNSSYSLKPMQSYPCPDMGVDKTRSWDGYSSLNMRNRATDFKVSYIDDRDSGCGDSERLPRWKQTCAYSKNLMSGDSITKNQISALNCYLHGNQTSGSELVHGITNCDYQEIMSDLCFKDAAPGTCPVGERWNETDNCPEILSTTPEGSMCRQWGRQPCSSAKEYYEEGENNTNLWPVCVSECCDNDVSSGLPGCGHRDDIIESEKSPSDNRDSPADILMKEWCVNNIDSPACDCISAAYLGDKGYYGDAYKTLRKVLDIGGLSGPQCWFAPCAPGPGDIFGPNSYDSVNTNAQTLLTSAEINPLARQQLQSLKCGGCGECEVWPDKSNPCCAALPECVNIVGIDDVVAMSGGDISQYAACEGVGGDKTYWTPVLDGITSQGECKSVRPCDCKTIYPKNGDPISPDLATRRDPTKCLHDPSANDTTDCPKGCGPNSQGDQAKSDSSAYEICWEGDRTKPGKKSDCSITGVNPGYCNCIACSAPRWDCVYTEQDTPHWECENKCGGGPDPDTQKWPSTCPMECIDKPIKDEQQCNDEGCYDYWECHESEGECYVSKIKTKYQSEDGNNCKVHCQCPSTSCWQCDENLGKCVCTSETGPDSCEDQCCDPSYSTYTDCVNANPKCPGKWTCDTTQNKCVSDPNGGFNSSDACILKCGGGYLCDPKTATCSLSDEGTPYKELEICETACKAPGRIKQFFLMLWNNKFMLLSLIITFIFALLLFYKSPKKSSKRSHKRKY